MSTLLQSLENILLCLLCFGLFLFAWIILHLKRLTQYNQPDCTKGRKRFYKENLVPCVLSFLEHKLFTKKIPLFETVNDLLIMNVKIYNPEICWFVNVGSSFIESGSG